jgi:hypothetical protein
MNEVIENKKKCEILAERIDSLSYGDIISHKQIATLIKEEYPSARYFSTIQKTKKILLKDFNKIIENISGDGYRVVNPDDFVEKSLKCYKRGFNSMKKGSDILVNSPTKDMTPEGREAHRRVTDRAIVLNASIMGATVELKELSKKSHPMDVARIGRR